MCPRHQTHASGLQITQRKGSTMLFSTFQRHGLHKSRFSLIVSVCATSVFLIKRKPGCLRGELLKPVFLVTDTKLAGTTSYVCNTFNGSCTQCGEPTTVNTRRQWAVFNCNTPIWGNRINVTQYSDYLAFCEVKVSDDQYIESS